MPGVPTPSVELMAGWLVLKKAHAMGSKRRFCRLVGTLSESGAKPPPPGSVATVAPDGGTGGSGFARVTLVMMRQEGEPPESGRALDLAEVGGIKLDPKVATCVLVQVAGQRQVRMTADSKEDAVRWLQEMRKHVSSA